MESYSPTIPKRRRSFWFVSAIMAFIAVIIEVIGNLIASDLNPLLKPYRVTIWMIFGIALIVAIGLTIWETRHRNKPPISKADNVVEASKGNVTVGGDVKESTIVTGDKNVVKTKK